MTNEWGGVNMEMQRFTVGRVPMTLWGAAAERGLLAVHGNQSNREDVPIAMLADAAQERGMQVLSLDLPEHGTRRREGTALTPANCRADILEAMRTAQGYWRHTGLFACSMGAYFALSALADALPDNALFLSPVIDFRALIEGMMAAANVDADALKRKKHIDTGDGASLDWDYYADVCAHPVERLPQSCAILAGTGDALCPPELNRALAERLGARLTLADGSEHYFHTKKDLRALQGWFKSALAEEA